MTPKIAHIIITFCFVSEFVVAGQIGSKGQYLSSHGNPHIEINAMPNLVCPQETP